MKHIKLCNMTNKYLPIITLTTSICILGSCMTDTKYSMDKDEGKEAVSCQEAKERPFMERLSDSLGDKSLSQDRLSIISKMVASEEAHQVGKDEKGKAMLEHIMDARLLNRIQKNTLVRAIADSINIPELSIAKYIPCTDKRPLFNLLEAKFLLAQED